VYSTISPSGVGMNAGTISPMPFSIQIATMARTHAAFNVPNERDAGSMKHVVATTFMPTAVQIHGTKARRPPSPKYR